LPGREPIAVAGVIAVAAACCAIGVTMNPSGRGHRRSGLRIAAKQENAMNFASIPLSPLIALIAGILILVMPRLLNYIVAIYLIVVGLLGLFPQLAG
jgi:hypothetical protein